MSFLTTANVVIGLIITLGTTLIGFVLWLVRQRSGISKEISHARVEDRDKLDGLVAEVHGLRDRVGQLEMEVRALPSAAAFNDLRIVVTRMEGMMSAQSAQMDGIREIVVRQEHTVHRMEDWMLKTGSQRGSK